MNPLFTWINEPKVWSRTESTLTVVTDNETDFWRETWYAFTRFSGHFFGCGITEDCTLQVKINADFQALYDQAGLMIMADDQHWLKAGVEYSDGSPLIGSVLTLGNSDWATGIYPGDASQFWMRLTLIKGCLRVQYSTDGIVWPLLRLCTFEKAQKYTVGLMCCTPQRAGLKVVFSDIRLTKALEHELHDLS